MRRFASVTALLIAVLSFGRSTAALPQATGLPDNATPTQTRLVVFEVFCRCA